MRAAALAFLGGILLIQQLAALPAPGWWWLLVPAFALAWRVPHALILVFFIAGAGWAATRAGFILDDRLAAELEGRDVVIEGAVADIPRRADYGVRFELEVAAMYAGGERVRAPSRVLVTSALHDFIPRAGERWRVRARLKRPHGFQNPGGYDYEAYLFRSRIGATGYVRAEQPPERIAGDDLRYLVDRIRQALGEHIAALLPDNAYAGLIVALANGDGHGVSDAQWEVLRRTGTLHLVAISGLHISLVGGIVFFLVRFLWSLPGFTVLRLPAPHAGAIAAMLAAVAYAALAGFVVPTQRALIMLAVAMTALLLRRHVVPSRLLAAALFLVLLYDPFSVMAPGFWLSFLAVAVIVYVMQNPWGREPWWRKWGYMQWAIAVGMMPAMLWLFQQVSLSAPFANLIAVPVFDLLAVPLTLAGVVALGASADSLAALLFQAAAGLLHALWQLLTPLAALEHAQWIQHRPATWALLCALVGVAWLLAPRGVPARAVGAIWLLPAVLIAPPGPQPGEVWFTLLDVGQGLAAVVRTSTHVLVYDSGARFSTRFDAGAAVVVPYLRARGIRRIDTLIISHGDNDHVGGAGSIVRALPVARVLTSVPDRFAGEPCAAGQTWSRDGIEFTIINPPPGAHGRDNDASCVLRVRAAAGTILLPGDIEKRAERRLLAEPEQLRADILVAPHHGSKTSSTEMFVEAVHPRHIAFPVGYRNRYRHPHPQVVARYQALGAELYDSPSAGALEFRLTDRGTEVAAFRRTHRRYWFAE